ncbi:MAG: four helix bundle protein [Bryobacterales bacterium]|nr:four helix bundle protein [Bryobacterales bacterium]
MEQHFQQAHHPGVLDLDAGDLCAAGWDWQGQALGSASELKYHLLLARDLKLIPLKDYEELTRRATEVKRMLTVLLQKLTADR